MNEILLLNDFGGRFLKNNTWNIPLLENLPEEVQKKLIKHSEHITYQKDSYLFREGELVDSICVIRKGRVKLTRFDALGRENIIMILSDNDTIWESMFLDGSVYPYSAVTLSSATVYKIHKNDFIRIVDDPTAAMNIIMLLSRKLHDANERNMLLSTKNPIARLAGFLLYNVDRSHDMNVSLKLEDIAASMSLRAETVSRKLKELEALQAVERTGHGKLKILNREKLKSIYENDGCC